MKSRSTTASFQMLKQTNKQTALGRVSSSSGTGILHWKTSHASRVLYESCFYVYTCFIIYLNTPQKFNDNKSFVMPTAAASFPQIKLCGLDAENTVRGETTGKKHLDSFLLKGPSRQIASETAWLMLPLCNTLPQKSIIFQESNEVDIRDSAACACRWMFRSVNWKLRSIPP